jgi:Type IV secretion system pilin
VVWSSTVFAAVPNNLPDPQRDFFNKLGAKWKDSVWLYDPTSLGINREKSLKDNVRDMFYPSAIGSNKLRPILQTIAAIIFFIFIVVIGATFLLNGDEDGEITKAKNSFLYLMYGWFLVFGSMWILRQLNVETSDGWASLVVAVRDKIIFNFISFMKAGAFFVAILLIIYHGLQIIRAYEKEDKLAEWRKAIINVLWVLVLIKVIDYVYFIAYAQDFKNKAVDLIISVSKFFGWWIGVLAVVYLIYAGYMLVIWQWESDRLKKSTNIIKWIFFAVLIIFLFLLTMYQLFKDLG